MYDLVVYDWITSAEIPCEGRVDHSNVIRVNTCLGAECIRDLCGLKKEHVRSTEESRGEDGESLPLPMLPGG